MLKITPVIETAVVGKLLRISISDTEILNLYKDVDTSLRHCRIINYSKTHQYWFSIFLFTLQIFYLPTAYGLSNH